MFNAEKEYQLADGRVVKLTRLKVRQAIEARRVLKAVNPNNTAEPDALELTAAMISQVASVDGKGVNYYDVLDWEFSDFMKIAADAGTGFTQEATTAAS